MYENTQSGTTGKSIIALIIVACRQVICPGRKVADETRRSKMSIGMILLIVLVLVLLGVIPSWGHSRSWGYGPSGGIGLVLLIVLILVVMGKI